MDLSIALGEGIEARNRTPEADPHQFVDKRSVRCYDTPRCPLASAALRVGRLRDLLANPDRGNFLQP
jgi:hypothetical protein